MWKNIFLSYGVTFGLWHVEKPEDHLSGTVNEITKRVTKAFKRQDIFCIRYLAFFV